MNYISICLDILALDNGIRFTGVISASTVKILAAEFRQSLLPFLTTKESELAIMQSVIRMSMRKTLEEKVGKVRYSTTIYDKVKVATIVIRHYNINIKGQKESEEEVVDELLLMVSFEKDSDHETIITKKILPFLDTIGKGLSSNNREHQSSG